MAPVPAMPPSAFVTGGKDWEVVPAWSNGARTAFSGGHGRHGLVIDLPADLPPVMADGRRLVLVLDNLLSNAARHSPDVIPIQMAATRDGAVVEVSVADGPEGILSAVRVASAAEYGALAAAGIARTLARTSEPYVATRRRRTAPSPARTAPRSTAVAAGTAGTGRQVADLARGERTSRRRAALSGPV